MSTCRDVRRLPSLLCCEGRDYFFPVLFDFNVFLLLPTGGGPACVARRAPPPAASPAPAAEPRPPVPGAGLVHVPRGPARIRSAPGWSDTAERRAHRRPSLWALGAPPLPHSGCPMSRSRDLQWLGIFAARLNSRSPGGLPLSPPQPGVPVSPRPARSSAPHFPLPCGSRLR